MAFKQIFKVNMLLLVMLHQASSCYTLYSELQQLGGSCFPQDSCLEYRPEEEDHLWNNFTCECGSHCVKHGTCCVDSPNVGQLLHVVSGEEECRKIPGMLDAVKVVSKCPHMWRYGYEIKNMCENNKADTDPIAMIPVTNWDTQVTYKNYFCALCNSDARDTSFWSVELHFMNKTSAQSLSNTMHDYILENLAYSDAEKSWGVRHNDSFHPINLKITLPKYLRKFVKKCYPNLISQCDPSIGHSFELHYKCLSYYAPIKFATGLLSIKFRNIHCALCNNINILPSDVNICKLESNYRKKYKPAFSFALLLDINTSDGDVVGKVELCAKNETWDPFYKKCRSLVCALPGYVLKNRKCVPN